MRRLTTVLFAMCSFVLTAQCATYRRHGTVYLNDLRATPGAVMNVSLQKLCQPGYSATVRNVPEAIKKQACEIYGVPPQHCNGREIEIDHLISLEIGGSNNIKNLWPQPYRPLPGAREKDKLENWLHRQVCSGRMPLGVAQRGIAGDWFEGYVRFVESPH